MIEKIALYVVHDFDLLTLHQSREFGTVVRESLSAVAENRPYQYEIKKIKPLSGVKRVNQVRIKITDPKVLELLQTIDKNRKSAYIKSVVRASLTGFEKLYMPLEHAEKLIQGKNKTEQQIAPKTEKKETKPFIMEPSIKPTTQAVEVQEEEDDGPNVFDLVETF